MRSQDLLFSARRLACSNPVLSVVVVALVVRLPVAGFVGVARNGVLFRDDEAYLRLVAAYSDRQTQLWSEDDWALWSSNRNFLLPLVWLYRLFGVEPLYPVVLAAIAGSLVAGLACYVVCQRLGSWWGLLTGLAVALFPSQILWSTTVLKDVYVWLATASVAAAISWWQERRTPIATVAVGVALASATLYLADIRRQAMLGMCLAIAAAAVVAFKRRRWLVVLALVAGLAVAPLAAGLGPFGWTLIKNGTAGREEVLSMALEDANTSIACVIVPFVQPAPADGAGWLADLKCLPAGLRTLVLDPFPNQLQRSTSMWPAFAEHLVWYPLLGLAAVGVIHVIRHRSWSPALVYVALLGASSMGMWGLVERNFGTAYRHRGEFVWCVVVFAAIGGHHLWERRRQPSPSAGGASSATGASSAANPSTAD